MKKYLKVFLLVPIFIFTAVSCNFAVLVSGYTMDNSSVPISGATVKLESATTTYYTVTVSSGYFEFNAIGGGGGGVPYVLTPSSDSWTFSPFSRAFNLGFVARNNQNFFGSNGVPMYTISGYTKDGSNVPISGVRVAMTGSATGACITDDLGYYEFANVPGGNYTITPVLASWTFSPSSMTYTSLSSDQQQDFTGSAPTYSISGTIIDNTNSLPVPGVTVALTGDQTGSQTTDSQGFFVFTGVRAGNYTLTPTKSNWTFFPVNRAVTVTTANRTGRNFTGTPVNPVYDLTGFIRDASSVAISGVTVKLTGYETVTDTTDVTGAYSFTNLSTGTYTVTPAKTNWSFAPSSMTYSPLVSNTTGQNYIGTYAGPTYKISGYVKDNSSTAVEGVTVTLGGDASKVSRTDAIGYYEFASLLGGNYTVTPTSANWVFSPLNRTLSSISADQPNQDFFGTLITYSISGTITSGGLPVPGVTVALTGVKIDTATTDGNGAYVFAGLLSGGYTVTPAKTNWTFAPLSSTIANLTASAVRNFTGTSSVPTYTLSGFILDSSNALPVAGLPVILTGYENIIDTTDVNGAYSFTNISSGTYTVTPAKANWTFGPASRNYSPLVSNTTGQNYIGTFFEPTYKISGYVKDISSVPVTGVTVTLGGDTSRTSTTDTLGYYEFLNLAPGNYAVTPSKTDYTFAPVQNSYNPLSSDQNNQDFTGTLTTQPPAQEEAINTVKPASLHLGPKSAVSKKINELKEKKERSKQ